MRDTETLFFDNGNVKWYKQHHFTDKIETQEASNLPKLKNLGVFRVENREEGINDLVLINDKQQVLKYYNYNLDGIGQMEAFINMLKIQKHYDDTEKVL